MLTVKPLELLLGRWLSTGVPPDLLPVQLTTGHPARGELPGQQRLGGVRLTPVTAWVEGQTASADGYSQSVSSRGLCQLPTAAAIQLERRRQHLTRSNAYKGTRHWPANCSLVTLTQHNC